MARDTICIYDLKISQTDFICTSDRVEVNITVDQSTAVNEAFENSALNIYPNPTSDVLSIDFPENYDLKALSIFNSLGQQVLYSKENLNQLYLGHLPAGHYIVDLTFAEQSIRTQLTLVN